MPQKNIFLISTCARADLTPERPLILERLPKKGQYFAGHKSRQQQQHTNPISSVSLILFGAMEPTLYSSQDFLGHMWKRLLRMDNMMVKFPYVVR